MALHAYADALETRRAELASRRATQSPLPWFGDALFDYGEQMLRAEHAWVAAFADRIPGANPGRSISEVSAMPPAVPAEMPSASPSDPAPARQPKLKPMVPRVVEMPDRTMAVARTTGDPNVVGPRVFPALYGAVYGLKFALKKQGIAFAVEPPAARWFGGADWATLPRDQWIAEWAIPVPPGTTSLAQKDPMMPVSVETWSYGLGRRGAVSRQLCRRGTDHQVPARLDHRSEPRDRRAHEEVYLSQPKVARPKTIIRYQVRPRGA